MTSRVLAGDYIRKEGRVDVESRRADSVIEAKLKGEDAKRWVLFTTQI